MVFHNCVLIYCTILGAFLINTIQSETKTAQHTCSSDPANADNIVVTFRIIPHNDIILSVYGFNASEADTSITANRIDACRNDATGIIDIDTDTIDFDITIDTTTSPPYECGAAVTQPSAGVKAVSFLFRTFTYSDTILSSSDTIYTFTCTSDTLTGQPITTGEIDATSESVVTLMRPQIGAYLIVRDTTTGFPVTSGSIADTVYLSVEFFPSIELGADNYANHFFAGFLGNDAISETSASELFILVLPKYPVRTDVRVTTVNGVENRTSLDGSVLKFVFPADMMGCSSGGEVELTDNGIEIESFSMDVAVLVCNIESDSEDCYTALPVDVTGTDYFPVTPVSDDAKELLIIGHEDGTAITITLSPSTSLTITADTVITEGGFYSVTLNKRQTLHLGFDQATPSPESLNGFHVASTSGASISVISGIRYNSGTYTDHMMEQIPPSEKLGQHYVLSPADPVADNRDTTYIVQAVKPGNTVVTRYLSNSVPETHTLAVTGFVTITVAYNEPCELTADQAILVLQIVNPPADAAKGVDPAMVVMPSVVQWNHKYTVLADTTKSNNRNFVTGVFPSLAAIDQYMINNSPSGSTDKAIAVFGPNGYQFFQGNSLPASMDYVLSSGDGFTKFMPLLYIYKDTAPSNTGTVTLIPGYKFPDQPLECFPGGYRGDGLDNDCDGKIDEEDGTNLIDDDGDGLINEDDVADLTTTAEGVGFVAVKPYNCKVSGDSSFADASRTVDITDASGCRIFGSGPFLIGGNFEPQTGDNIGSGTQPKILHSGSMELGMFTDRTGLFFSCDITYCFTADDTTCTTNICPSRKKRQAETSENTSNITTHISIRPYISNIITPSNATESSTTSASVGECLENVYIQTAMILLMLVTLLALGTAICFCCLFRRRREQNKRRPSTSYYNHSMSRKSL